MIILPAAATWEFRQDNGQFNASICTGKVEVATKGIKYDWKTQPASGSSK